MDRSCREARSDEGLLLTSVLARAQVGPESWLYHRVLPPGGALVLNVPTGAIICCQACLFSFSPLLAKRAVVPLQLISARAGPGLVRCDSAVDARAKRSIKLMLECNGWVIIEFKREALVAASKGSFRSENLKAIQSKEDCVLWVSKVLETKQSLKRQADSIRLPVFADGVVPLDLACPSSREALPGPAGT
jgi:hypothetical protein